MSVVPGGEKFNPNSRANVVKGVFVGEATKSKLILASSIWTSDWGERSLAYAF